MYTYFINYSLNFKVISPEHPQELECQDPPRHFQPWKEEGSFCWETYIEFGNAKAAPSKLFKCPFPADPNPFKRGMKLEAIDPEHPAFICIVTVAEIVGK